MTRKGKPTKLREVGYGFEYYTDDFNGTTGGFVVCDTEEQARAEQQSLLANGWTITPIRQVEYR